MQQSVCYHGLVNRRQFSKILSLVVPYFLDPIHGVGWWCSTSQPFLTRSPNTWRISSSCIFCGDIFVLTSKLIVSSPYLKHILQQSRSIFFFSSWFILVDLFFREVKVFLSFWQFHGSFCKLLKKSGLWGDYSDGCIRFLGMLLILFICICNG